MELYESRMYENSFGIHIPLDLLVDISLENIFKVVNLGFEISLQDKSYWMDNYHLSSIVNDFRLIQNTNYYRNSVNFGTRQLYLDTESYQQKWGKNIINDWVINKNNYERIDIQKEIMSNDWFTNKRDLYGFNKDFLTKPINPDPNNPAKFSFDIKYMIHDTETITHPNNFIQSGLDFKDEQWVDNRDGHGEIISLDDIIQNYLLDTDGKFIRDARGLIVLYTELIPCISCKRAIDLFRYFFPNIELVVLYSFNNVKERGDFCNKLTPGDISSINIEGLGLETYFTDPNIYSVLDSLEFIDPNTYEIYDSILDYYKIKYF